VTGHKKEIRPGVWKLRVSVGKDPATGRYIYVSKTIKGGSRIADKHLAEMVVAAKGLNSTVSLRWLVEEFLKLYENSGFSPGTISVYRNLSKSLILPILGDHRIDTLTAHDLDSLYRALSARGLGAARVRHAHSLLRRMLGQAVRWGWLDKNVALLASPPAPNRSVASAPSPEELDMILEAAESENAQMVNFFACCALTGARRGEVLALRWSDFALDAMVLTIARSVGYTPEAGIYVKSTKTHGVRRLGVDKTLEGVITSQMEMLRSVASQGFKHVADPFLFFNEPDGSKPLFPAYPSKVFRRICDGLGLPYHLHQLRHFTATQLIGAGVDVRTVSGRLGHADASITLRVYSHALEVRDREAAEYMGSVVKVRGRNPLP